MHHQSVPFRYIKVGSDSQANFDRNSRSGNVEGRMPSDSLCVHPSITHLFDYRTKKPSYSQCKNKIMPKANLFEFQITSFIRLVFATLLSQNEDVFSLHHPRRYI